MPVCSRRILLAGLAGLGVAGSLVGCGTPAPEQTTIDVAEVPVGSGIITAGFVVLQPTAGEFLAYDARCPHADVLVTSVDSAGIHCRIHDAWFDAATGDAISGPTTEAMTAVPVRRDGDLLTVG